MNFEDRVKKMYSTFHKHECDTCGTIWEHPDICGGHTPSHKCPTCGSYKHKRYEGPGKADFTFAERHGV